MQRHIFLGGLTAATLLGSAVLAEVPRVATDIAPVHSLVRQVMGDLGEPDLILPPGASPHGYSLRPSEARALAGADVVFWVGEALAPWMEGVIASLSGGAVVVELLETEGTQTLPFREEAAFALRMPEDGGGGHDGHEGHDHSGADPHAWLDPQNMIAWTRAIATTLSAADPENAATYAANADQATAELTTLTTRINERLTPVRGLSYVVFHDAYQYFETRFDMPAAGAISLGDATDPGAARVAVIRDLVRDQGVTCIATEPQFNPALVEAVAGGADLRTTILDPLGTGLEPGAGFYDALITALADGLLACR